MVTSDQTSIRYNPTGAVEVDAGGTRLVMGLRGDLSGDSELMKKVNKTVVKYTAQSF